MTGQPENVRVAIIVLNWNGKYDTVRCVESLRAWAPEASIVVVDNGSTDGSVAVFRSHWPDLEIIETGANLGYAGGNNVGLRRAINLRYDVIGVLNNDTIVRPGFLGSITDLIARSASPVVVSPVIHYLGSDRIWFAGSQLDERRGIYVHAPLTEAPSAPTESPSLTGCALFAERNVWEKIGLFDESFFLIFEDAEWCQRAKRCSYSLIVDPASKIDHAVSSTFEASGSRIATYYYLRNGLRLHSRNRVSPRQRLNFWLHTARHGLRLKHGRQEFVDSTSMLVRATIDGLRDKGGGLHL